MTRSDDKSRESEMVGARRRIGRGARGIIGRVRVTGMRAPRSLAVLILLGAVAGGTIPRFLTVGNLATIAAQDAILTVAACGEAIVIITAGIDLSTGASVGLVSVVIVLLIASHGALVAIAAGICAGLAIGALNGGLVGGFGIAPFLVTLGTLTVAEGLASVLAGGAPLAGPANLPVTWLVDGRIGVVPVPVVVALSSVAILHILLRGSRLGRSWYLVGVSARAAELAGLNVRAAKFFAYLIGSAFVVVAGCMLTGQVASGQPNLDPNLAFYAIAGCAIGGLPLTGGAGGAGDVLIGSAIFSLASNAIILANFSVYWQLLLTGGIIVGAVGLQSEQVLQLGKRVGSVVSGAGRAP